MGCESSRSIEVENTISKSEDLKDLRERLTDLQIDVIKSTWPILSKDTVDIGIRLMRDLFLQEPNTQHLFPVRGLQGDELERSETLREHALRVMRVFALVTECLEDTSRDPEVNDFLLMLGAKHASMKGFEPAYFPLFQESLHNAWEWNLGEEYIEDVRDAWDVLFSFIINKFSFGYKCYIADRDSEPQTTALQERTTDSTKE